MGKLKNDVIRAHIRPPKLCRLDEETLFYIFAHLVNGLINFLAHLTIWLIDDFGVFTQPQFVIFLSANCIQIDTVVLRSEACVGCALRLALAAL